MSAGIIFISGLSVMCAQHYIYSSTGIAVPLSLLEQSFPEFALSWLQIFTANIVMLPEIFIMIFILLKLFKPEENINSKSLFQQKLADLGTWTVEEKKCIFVLSMMFVFFVTNRWHGFDLTYGFIGACVLFYLPFINIGKKENIEKINISVILVICGCMLIGTAGTAAGITQFVSTLIAPLLQSGNHFIFIAATWFSGVLANIIMTPMALMTTLTIPMAQIGQNIGIDPSVIAYTLQHTADYVIFPYESTFFLIMYGFGMMTMKQFIKGAAALTIVGGVLTIGLCGIWWTVLGLM